MILATFLLAGCIERHDYTVTVEVLPEVAAALAEELPAYVVVHLPIGSAHALGVVCEVPEETLVFTTEETLLGCVEATEVSAWLDVPEEAPEGCGALDSPEMYAEDGYGHLASAEGVLFDGVACGEEAEEPGEVTLVLEPP